MWRRWFLDHPRSVGETYFQHQRLALSVALRLFSAAGACVVHALVPALFTSTGSRTIAELHARIIAARKRVPETSNDDHTQPMDSKVSVL